MDIATSRTRTTDAKTTQSSLLSNGRVALMFSRRRKALAEVISSLTPEQYEEMVDALEHHGSYTIPYEHRAIGTIVRTSRGRDYALRGQQVEEFWIAANGRSHDAAIRHALRFGAGKR